MRTKKPRAFSRLTTTLVSSKSLYYSWSYPKVRVTVIPKSQIRTVLQTSANDLETGDMSLETVTAMGTEIPIEIMSPILSNMRKVLSVTCYQYTLIF